MLTCKRPLLLLILPLLTLCAMGFNPVQAYSFSESYIAPEVMYADQLAQKIQVPTKINLNRASFNEIKTLPGMDESMALKLMRIRPLENIRDFYRMPWVSPKDVQVLIQRVQSRVTF